MFSLQNCPPRSWSQCSAWAQVGAKRRSGSGDTAIFSRVINQPKVRVLNGLHFLISPVSFGAHVKVWSELHPDTSHPFVFAGSIRLRRQSNHSLGIRNSLVPSSLWELLEHCWIPSDASRPRVHAWACVHFGVVAHRTEGLCPGKVSNVCSASSVRPFVFVGHLDWRVSSSVVCRVVAAVQLAALAFCRRVPRTQHVRLSVLTVA